jgi:uncharacterized iron-regulated membrane protein
VPDVSSDVTIEAPRDAAEAPVETARTRTESAARPRARKPWWRRRPARRGMVLAHRWVSLVLGLFLVVETTTGAIVLFHNEYFRATHSGFYRHTASSQPIGAERAFALVQQAHPGFGAWVAPDHGVYVVGDATYTEAYAVDPGTGHLNGHSHLTGGTMGLLVNLHDCAFTCVGYPGYVGWLTHPIPTLGISWLHAITWGSFVIGTLGLMMILLALTGIATWWPGRKRLAHGLRVRTGKGRFARDYDLHNLIGIIAVPFVLMWGVTGAAFEFPVVQTAWLAVTGGHGPDENRYPFEANEAPRGAPAVSLEQASAVALQHAPGRVAYIVAPADGAEYWSVDIATGFASYNYRSFYGGDTDVYVDAHDPSHVKVVDTHGKPAGNRFYDKVFEPAHFGWMVNGWWRIGWVPFGLAPLALMVTGLSTWLFRRGVRRRRAKAAA